MDTVDAQAMLPKKFIEPLQALSEARLYAPEALITRQGALERELFYIKRGSVHIVRRNEDGTVSKTATLYAGGFFGEVGLILDEARTADVIAAEECEVLVLDYRTAHELIQKEPELHFFLERTGLNRWAHSVLLTSPFLLQLPGDVRKRLIHEAEVRPVPPGTTLFDDGRQTPYLWFLISGMVDVQTGPESWEEVEAVSALNKLNESGGIEPVGRCSAVTECLVACVDAGEATAAIGSN